MQDECFKSEKGTTRPRAVGLWGRPQSRCLLGAGERALSLGEGNALQSGSLAPRPPPLAAPTGGALTCVLRATDGASVVLPEGWAPGATGPPGSGGPDRAGRGGEGKLVSGRRAVSGLPDPQGQSKSGPGTRSPFEPRQCGPEGPWAAGRGGAARLGERGAGRPPPRPREPEAAPPGGPAQGRLGERVAGA